jgi:hypothetical protein
MQDHAENARGSLLDSLEVFPEQNGNTKEAADAKPKYELTFW